MTAVPAAVVAEVARAGRAAPPPAIALSGVSKAYGHGHALVPALDGVDLTLPVGELLCVVGASGCGKSTLLNLVAGLDQPSAGGVEVRGRAAMIFQESALFPWLSVTDNVELALRLRGVPRRERKARAEELLTAVHLRGFGGKRPHELSGGMRQRVAIARAFAQDADILLMDEPFAALDAMTRDLLHHELERLWMERALTIVFVTHNVREAVRLADRVVVLSSRPGRVAAEFDVDIERPRRIESSSVSSLARLITDRLRSEMRRHGDG